MYLNMYILSNRALKIKTTVKLCPNIWENNCRKFMSQRWRNYNPFVCKERQSGSESRKSAQKEQSGSASKLRWLLQNLKRFLGSVFLRYEAGALLLSTLLK